LYRDFFDIGYDLFQDKDIFNGTFVAADVFDLDSMLRQFQDKVDMIWTSNMLHLFTWDQQVKIIGTMLKLLKSSPDPMIAGRFMGHSAAGEYAMRSKEQVQSIYRHNDQSFEQMFQASCDALVEEWEVEIEAPEWSETLNLKTDEGLQSTWTVEVKFVAHRLAR
jgi:hypothetical protein